MSAAFPPLSITARLSVVAAAVNFGADAVFFEPLEGGGVLAVAFRGDDRCAVFADPAGNANRAASLQISKSTVEAVATAVAFSGSPNIVIENIDGFPWLNKLTTLDESGFVRHVAELNDPPPDWRALICPSERGVAA